MLKVRHGVLEGKRRGFFLLVVMTGLMASGSALRDLDDLARVADDFSCGRRPFEVEGRLGSFGRDFRSSLHPWHYCIVDGRGGRGIYGEVRVFEDALDIGPAECVEPALGMVLLFR